jgi:hypothetical protein
VFGCQLRLTVHLAGDRGYSLSAEQCKVLLQKQGELHKNQRKALRDI